MVYKARKQYAQAVEETGEALRFSRLFRLRGPNGAGLCLRRIPRLVGSQASRFEGPFW